jgi:SH3-like domain-containing protein
MKNNYEQRHKFDDTKQEATIKETIEMEQELDPEPIEVEATLVIDAEIANCAKVNVRTTPEMCENVLLVLNQGSPIKIDQTYKSEEWFKIVTEAGVEGYVKKQFVKEV